MHLCSLNKKLKIMRFLLILLISISIFSCSSDADMMRLTGNVKGLKKGTLYLEKIEDTLLVAIDSIVVNGQSNFSFKTSVESPEVYYLHVLVKDGSSLDDRISFFAEKGDIEIQTNLKTFGSGAIITGSENNKLLSEYNRLMNRYIERNLDLVEQRLRLKSNDPKIEEIMTQQKSLMSSRYLATINFALNNKDREIAPYLMLSEAYDANVKYLDTVYSSLDSEIKNSKYGKELESFIMDRKKNDSIL